MIYFKNICHISIFQKEIYVFLYLHISLFIFKNIILSVLCLLPALYQISAWQLGILFYIIALVNVDRVGLSRDTADVRNKFRGYFRDRSCSHKRERERKIFLFLAQFSFSRRTRRYLLLSRGLWWWEEEREAREREGTLYPPTS